MKVMDGVKQAKRSASAGRALPAVSDVPMTMDILKPAPRPAPQSAETVAPAALTRTAPSLGRHTIRKLTAVALLILGSAACVWLAHDSPPDKAAALATRASSTATPAPTSTPTPASKAVTAGVDCGTVVTTDLSKSSFTGCFNQAFAGCHPAHVTVDTEAAILKGTMVTYIVQGQKNGFCMVTWSYLALPDNMAWAGQDVTCPYVQGSDFQAALGAKLDFSGCMGPLLTAMGAAAK